MPAIGFFAGMARSYVNRFSRPQAVRLGRASSEEGSETTR